MCASLTHGALFKGSFCKLTSPNATSHKAHSAVVVRGHQQDGAWSAQRVRCVSSDLMPQKEMLKR